MGLKILMGGMSLYLLGVFFYLRPIKTNESYNVYGVFCLVVGFLLHMVGLIAESYKMGHIPFDSVFGVTGIIMVFFLGEYMFLEYRHKVQRLAFTFLGTTAIVLGPSFFFLRTKTALAAYTDIIFAQFFFACLSFALASLLVGFVSRYATISIENRCEKATKTAMKVFKKTRRFEISSSFLAMIGSFGALVSYVFILLEMQKMYFLNSAVAAAIAFAVLLGLFFYRKKPEAKDRVITGYNMSAFVVLLIALFRLII